MKIESRKKNFLPSKFHLEPLFESLGNFEGHLQFVQCPPFEVAMPYKIVIRMILNAVIESRTPVNSLTPHELFVDFIDLSNHDETFKVKA